MATIQIRFNDGNIGEKFRATVEAKRSAILNAVSETLDQVSAEILEEGRADISGAGNFGSRWTDGLQSAQDFGPDRSSITIFNTQVGFRLFEFGGTVQGRPLLWIPLSFSDAVGIRASEYGALFRVNRKSGAPLLLSKDDKQPKYFGKEQVTIPQKFHIREIIERVASRMGEIFKSKLR